MIHVGGLAIGRSVLSAAGAKYRVMQEVGQGGNCRVYLVVAVSGANEGVLFALKVFTKTQDADRLAQFHREAAFLRACSHPAIMKVFDQGTLRVAEGGTVAEFPFVVADYYTATLDRALQVGLRLADKVVFMLQLLSAVKYLSSLSPQIVHRDIKPQNIFLRGNSCALGDFGLLREVGPGVDGGEEERNVFKMSAGAGMPRWYRTPDLVRYAKNEVDITCSSDTFQLGLVAAVMFCGRNPLRTCKGLLDPVELDPLVPVSGSLGASIMDGIHRMLVMDSTQRESPSVLLEHWDGVLAAVTNNYHMLEGRVF